MKFSIFSLLLIAMLFSLKSNSQGCSDLLISEVVEGWSNNKAIEIYNPTDTAIDASEYGLVRFQNGNSTPGNITYLTDVTVDPYDVFVVVLDKTDPDGVDFEAPVWEELQLQADSFINPVYNDGLEVMYFNGNDALALLKDDGQTLVDVFGKIGDSLNPDGWGGYLDDEGEQAYISANHTLVRKPSIIQGYLTNPSSFDILSEYDSLAANTFTELGSHECDCNVNSVEKIELAEVKIFPNPSTNGNFVITADQGIKTVKVFNSVGVLVEELKFENEASVYTDLSELDKGSYFMSVLLNSGEEISKVIIR